MSEKPFIGIDYGKGESETVITTKQIPTFEDLKNSYLLDSVFLHNALQIQKQMNLSDTETLCLLVDFLIQRERALSEALDQAERKKCPDINKH